MTCGLGFAPGGRRFQACSPISCQQRRVWASGATRAQGSHSPECASTFSRRHLKTQGHIGVTLVARSVFQRFRQRFRHVSGNVSVTFLSTFPLRFHWAGVSPMETIRELSQRFRDPLSIYIYIYIYIYVCVLMYIHTYIYIYIYI